jgi:cellulose biosynthesis protein BcsQ
MAEFGEDLTKEFRRGPRVTALKNGIPSFARLASLWEEGSRRLNRKSVEPDRTPAEMAVCLAIANPKGGVGKSLTTLMLADGLALAYGARVLVFDADPQAGITQALLGFAAQDDLDRQQIGLGPVLRNWAQGQDIDLASHCVPAGDLTELRNRHPGRIDLIPSNHQLLGEIADIEHTARHSRRRDRLDVLLAGALRSAFRKVQPNYDIVLIDCPAGPGALGLAALRLARHILTPTNLETNSYSTLVGFLQFILDDDLDLASQVKVHPLITQYHASNTLQRQMLDHIQQGHSGLNAIGRPIAYATALQGAASHPGAGSFRTAREKYGNSLADVLGLAQAVAQRISSGD